MSSSPVPAAPRTCRAWSPRKTLLPVLGVPIPATLLVGIDSLLSIVQMPKGVPVGTLAIGKPGAANAGLLAAAIVRHEAPRAPRAAPRVARGAKREVLAQTVPQPLEPKVER